MAVYKRTYRPYAGPRTAAWPRFFILTRYGWTRLFQSKFHVLALAASLFYPVGCLAYLYVVHAASFLAMFRIQAGVLPTVNGHFFYSFCIVQGAAAYLLAALVGPGLVSPDLANGALPLYFSRPFSRLEYVAGKMTLLMFLLSLMTWIPGLVLFGVEVTLKGWDWGTTNFWMVGAIFVGLLVWVLLLSLIALAFSAWVKWKIAAGALVLGLFFVGAGFGAAINNVWHTHYGTLLDLNGVMRVVWADLLRYDSGTQVSLSAAWAVLAAAGAICLGLLAKRVRPFEVVR